jgi:hypothetical protein
LEQVDGLRSEGIEVSVWYWMWDILWLMEVQMQMYWNGVSWLKSACFVSPVFTNLSFTMSLWVEKEFNLD